MAAGWGVAAGRAWGVGTGRGVVPFGRLPLSLEGPPLGPPGRKSLPLVTGRAATGLGRGVGLETELGGSPGPV